MSNKFADKQRCFSLTARLKPWFSGLLILFLTGCSLFQPKPEIIDQGPAEKPLPEPLVERYNEGLELLQQAAAEEDSGEQQQQHQAAADFWQALSQQYPQYPGVWSNLALSHYRLGNYDASLESLVRAHDIDAEYCPAFKLKALVQRQLGKFSDAESSYLAAAECAPEDADIPYNLGILYDLYLNDLEKALVQYRKAQSLISGEDAMLAIWIPDLERRCSVAADNQQVAGE